jgi:hypothetical protein
MRRPDVRFQQVKRQHLLSVSISARGPEADMNLAFDSSARSWALPPPDLTVSCRLSIVNMELPRGGLEFARCLRCFSIPPGLSVCARASQNVPFPSFHKSWPSAEQRLPQRSRSRGQSDRTRRPPRRSRPPSRLRRNQYSSAHARALKPRQRHNVAAPDRHARRCPLARAQRRAGT